MLERREMLVPEGMLGPEGFPVVGVSPVPWPRCQSRVRVPGCFYWVPLAVVDACNFPASLQCFCHCRNGDSQAGHCHPARAARRRSLPVSARGVSLTRNVRGQHTLLCRTVCCSSSSPRVGVRTGDKVMFCWRGLAALQSPLTSQVPAEAALAWLVIIWGILQISGSYPALGAVYLCQAA